MKGLFRFYIFFGTIFIYVSGLGAAIWYVDDIDEPAIVSYPTVFTKYIDQNGNESWPDGRMASVSIVANVEGLGIGQGTLEKISIAGKTYDIHQDPPAAVGTKTNTGSRKYDKEYVWATKFEKLPDEEGSWVWRAEGTIKITPYVYQVSTTLGTIFSPTGPSGTFSTTGRWILEDNRSVTRSAPSGESGMHRVEFKFRCVACRVVADTLEALSPDHDEVTCSSPACNVRYRKCTPPSGHVIHKACGNRRCDGQDHSRVGICASRIAANPLNTYIGCHRDIYKCTEVNHRVETCSVGHKYRVCVGHVCSAGTINPATQEKILP